MRVNPISVNYGTGSLKKTVGARKNVPETQSPAQPEFRGNLKLPDYIAGTICGTAVTVVVSSALCPPLGILAGLISAKAAAEANSDSRK